MIKWSQQYVIVPLIVWGTIGLALRFLDMHCNLPEWFSPGVAAKYIDEGYKLHSARNMVQYGAWRWSEDDQYAGWSGAAAIFNHGAIRLMRIYGVRLHPIRITVAILGTVSAILLYIAIGLRFGYLSGAVAFASVSVAFAHIAFSRIALLEVPQSMFVTIALVGVLMSTIWLGGIVGIIGLGLAYLVKPSAMMYLIAILPGLGIVFAEKVMTYTNAMKLQRIEKHLIGWAGATVVGGYVALWSLFPDVLNRAGLRSLAGPTQILNENLLSTFARSDPVLFGVGIVSCMFLLVRPMTRTTAPGWVIVGSLGIFGNLMLTLLEYSPVRYHVFLTPVFAIATAIVVSEARQGELKKTWRLLPTWSRGLMSGAIVYGSANLIGGVIHFLFRDSQIGSDLGLTAKSAFVIGLALGIVSLFVLQVPPWRGAPRLHSKLRGSVWGISGGCLVIWTVFGVGQISEWWANRSHSLYEARLQLAAVLPGTASVAGPWAPALCFEIPVRTIYLARDLNERTLSRLRPSHFLFVNTEEGEYLKREIETGRFVNLTGMSKILTVPVDSTLSIELHKLNWEISSETEKEEGVGSPRERGLVDHIWGVDQDV